MSGDDAFDPDLLAAELAFGLLDADERAAAQALLARDPAFARMVARWRRVGEVLADEEEAPRPSLWEAIAAKLPANEDGRELEPATPPARPWKIATGTLAAASLALGVLALDREERPPAPRSPPPNASIAAAPLTAVLRGDDGRAVIAVAFDRDRGRLTVIPSALTAGAGAIELWVIPADGQPRSLGLVQTGGARSRVPSVTLRPVLAPGSTLAVTREPAGGSPTGRPGQAPFLTGVLTPS